MATSLLIPCVNCAEQVALGQGNARRAQADAELYTQEQQVRFSADTLLLLWPCSASVGLFPHAPCCPNFGPQRALHGCLSSALVGACCLQGVLILVFICGIQLLICAALQAKALIVKAQAQAQANLYTQEQQARTFSISTYCLPWQCEFVVCWQWA